jgi:hypothetical protein
MKNYLQYISQLSFILSKKPSPPFDEEGYKLELPGFFEIWHIFNLVTITEP